MDAQLYYTPKPLQVGEFKEACERAVAAVLGPNAKITVKHRRRTAEGIDDETELDVESLRPLVDLGRIRLSLIAYKEKDKQDKFIFKEWSTIITCHGDREAFCMEGIDEPSVLCLQRIALNLGLEQRTKPKDSVIKALEDFESRVSILEKATAAIERRLKCFISFKFDDPQITVQVERLKRFLSALGLEWVTGEQFEPRRIEDKVKAKLRADVDFVVAVISKAGESKWIRDEIADANARDLWVVLLLENGATFDKGIFGTLEYIGYELAIDQTFLALIEGINFIKAEVSARASQNAANSTR